MYVSSSSLLRWCIAISTTAPIKLLYSSVAALDALLLNSRQQSSAPRRHRAIRQYPLYLDTGFCGEFVRPAFVSPNAASSYDMPIGLASRHTLTGSATRLPVSFRCRSGTWFSSNTTARAMAALKTSLISTSTPAWDSSASPRSCRQAHTRPQKYNVLYRVAESKMNVGGHRCSIRSGKLGTEALSLAGTVSCWVSIQILDAYQ